MKKASCVSWIQIFDLTRYFFPKFIPSVLNVLKSQMNNCVDILIFLGAIFFVVQNVLCQAVLSDGASLQDEDAIDSLFSHIIQTYPHSVLSIFADGEKALESSLKYKKTDANATSLNKEVYLSTSLLKLNVSLFESDLDFISSAGHITDSNIAIIVPRTKQILLDILEKIGSWEANNFDRQKLENFIIWPKNEICTTFDCLRSEILNTTFQQLPKISSTTFILHWNGNSDSVSKNNNNNHTWNLYGIYSAGRNNVTHLNPVSWEDINCPFSSRKDFKGAILKATLPFHDTVLPEEISYNLNNETGELTERSGFSFNIMEYIEKALNLKLEFLFSKLWIVKENGEWSGMAKQLNDNEADVAVVKSTMIPFRHETNTFLTPLFSEGIHAFFRQPAPSSIRNIFIQPFTKQLWATLIVVWILVFSSQIITAKIKAHYNQLLQEDEEISKDSLFIAIAFTCQQGWHLDPQAISMRLIFFCGSVIGLIVYVAYSAALVSSLSAVITPIKTFDDLLFNDKFSITYEPESHTMESLLSQKSSYGDDDFGTDHVTLLKMKTRPIETSLEGVGLVFRTSTAFLSFSHVFYSFARDTFKKSDRDLCEQIAVVKISKVPFRSGMAVPKSSNYKEFFNFQLISLYENGLINRFQKHYILSFHGNCDKQQNKKGVGLGLNDLFTAYVVMLSGYAISFTILIMERLHFKRVNSVFLRNDTE